ncbi:hypothetical protein IB274_03000 [Pseudomonas sp. PDM18]|uniref:LasR-specific antiactivator QslA n=1 Tax=Pseudomonas sp. PDM18 TaxID=2769253 RepID=UPI00177DA6CC|nr:LasR-specific antiactivator QslA [Pseudomonas sp. PDM18]MBD9675647.1 hypothetical protein [Pseudomonas sp. PDM18]
MSSDNNTHDPESELHQGLRDTLSSSDNPVTFKLPPDWPEESDQAMAYGTVVARQWLFAPGGESLWTCFARGRTVQSDMLDRMAFEIGFLTHLQQQIDRLPQ